MIKKVKEKYNNQLKDKDFFEILKGGFVSLIAKAITVVFGMFFSYIITQYYGAAEMGIFSIVSSYFSVALIFSMMGMHTAIVRFIPEHIVKFSAKSAFKMFFKVLKIVFLLSLIISVLGYFLSDYLAANFFDKEYLGSLFALASFFIVFQALARISKESIRALKNIKIYSLIEVLNATFKIVFLGILTYFFYSEYNSVYTLFASQVFLFVIGLFLVVYLFNRKKSLKNEIYKPSNIKVIKIAFPMFLTGLMTVVISQTDVIMLGMFNSVEEVGVYAIAIRIATLTSFVLVAINSIATPKFSELYHAGKIGVLTSIAQKSSKLIFWISVPIIFIFILFGKFILSIFGEDFIVGYTVLLLISIGQLVNGMAGSVGSFLNMTGHQIVFNRIIIMGGIINIVLNYILIPLYGITGAGIASMVSIILWNLVASLYIKFKFGFYIGYIPIRIFKFNN